MEIKLNNKTKTTVRLIAFPVSEEIAENRRRKAKKELKGNPPAGYLELLGWSIYLTTIGKETADAEKIFGFYKLRWRIEIIFKCWKSNMAFDKVHNVSKIQLWVIIWSRFILIIICTQFIYTPCRILIKTNANKDLSLMKVTQYLIRNPQKLIQILNELQSRPNEPCLAIKALAKYCCYETRKRSHYQQDLKIIYR